MDRKKLLSIILGIVFLAVAGTTVVKTMSGGVKTDATLEKEMTLLKCNAANCGAVFDISMKDYYKGIQEKATGMSVPGLTCKKCGKDTAYSAMKCDKCSTVFFCPVGSAADADKCPKCGFSKSENGSGNGSKPQ